MTPDAPVPGMINQSGMDNDALIRYFMQMGALRPEEEALQRQQGLIDKLREQQEGGGGPYGGAMVSGHYVRPSPLTGFSNAAGQAAGAYFGAKNQQQQMDLAKRRAGMPLPGMGGGGVPSTLPGPMTSPGGYGDVF